MYSIEYYQNERSKPTIEIPNYSSDNRKRNSMKRRAYLRRKDVIDKCGNIQSLTIDVADIKNVIYDDRLNHLPGLYARINGLNINDVKTIKIFNDNSVNLLYIYSYTKPHQYCENIGEYILLLLILSSFKHHFC